MQDELPHAKALQNFITTGGSVIDGALIVATIIDEKQGYAETEQAEAVHAEIDRLAGRVDRLGGAAEIVETMREQGFEGAGEHYYDIENSIIDHVLETKRGIPISLGVVAMGIAERLGVAAEGINFPRHFLALLDGTLIDPYALRVVTEEQCRQWLDKNNVTEAHAFAKTTTVGIVLRMLNNVRTLLHRSRNFAHALTVSDYQLMIVPRLYGIYIERCDAWMALDSPHMAVQELKKAIEFAPGKNIAERLRQRMEEIEGKSSEPPVMH